MSASGNNPNINPADNDSLAGVVRFAFQQLMRGVDGMLPARVLAYDRTANRVQVELMIAMITTSGAQVSRAQIANLPVINLGGGGYILNFPLKEGDLGFVCANDRDISLFLQSYKESPPNTMRVKSFSDGVFIPSVLTGYDVSAEDGKMVIQNLDGTVRIALSETDIRVTAPAIFLDSPVTTVTGELVVEGLTRTTAGLAVTGIATTVYAGYFGGPMYVLGNGDSSVAFTPGVPGAPIPPPPPP
jgi:hypothetical protein